MNQIQRKNSPPLLFNYKKDTDNSNNQKSYYIIDTRNLTSLKYSITNYTILRKKVNQKIEKNPNQKKDLSTFTD